MSKAVRDRILKDANGDINDHLRNHIHLTNCIHLKNHMHKHSSILADRSLMRDIMVLQRSRSLKDPSPCAGDLVLKNDDKDAVWEGRRYETIEKQRGERGLSVSSPPLANFSNSKVVPIAVNEGVPAISDHSGKNGTRDGRRIGREKSSRRSNRIDLYGENKETQGVRLKTLSEQFNYPPMDSYDVGFSNVDLHGSHVRPEKIDGEPEISIRGRSRGLNRVKRRKFRRARRSYAGSSSREVGGPNECGERNVTHAPSCGIPFNWSSIHYGGKTFLDIAGRSFSCGLSDTRIRKGGAGSHGINVREMPLESDQSSSSAKSNGEAQPLLIEASESLDSAANAGCSNVDSDIGSEAGSVVKRKLGRNVRGRHQNMTQKYMPKTFRDVVGQNLVSQALSNAVMKRKVGLLYVFYGPHGTGKTSCARIFARALNCQSLEQTKPCGFCNSCISHDTGKNRNIREVGPLSNIDFEAIMDRLDNMINSRLPSQYRVFIFDDCDTLSPDRWSSISKVIDRVPRRVVFVFISSSLDILPHIIISKCQKFSFPKLKDGDVVYALQRIASREDIEIEKDALKLIASLSDGSLRDAEMTLEQLSLLGQRISVPLVQELAGLISDEKLVDLLDLALSADTVNTIKSLRVIIETGVEPLALMSQLATVITDVLAGSYDFSKEKHRRKFFRRQPLSKEDMEKLRQALKTLSEAEKQLRTSNDKLTWLTAALLQLAPYRHYELPISSSGNSSHHSPLPLNDAGGRDVVDKGGELVELHNNSRVLSTNSRLENLNARSPGDFETGIMKGKRHALGGIMAPQNVAEKCNGIDEIWLEVLEKIQVNNLKEFLYREGKLMFVNLGAAPTVQLMFSSQVTKSKAEKFRGHILEAFESVLGSPVTITIRSEAKKDVFHELLDIPASGHGPSQMVMDPEFNYGNRLRSASFDDSRVTDAVAYRKSALASTSGRQKVGELSQSRSIVRSKVSLAHVIQHAEGCKQRYGLSKPKAVSIAEQIEKENLRLEPRSRSLLCWKTSRITRRKPSRLKTRTRRQHSILKLVSCGKCLSSR